MSKKLRLGVNIDHVATIRNARGGLHPDPVRAAAEAKAAGADGITAHLREDRRHISDHDIRRLRSEISLPLNLEMAATGEMLDIAMAHTPNACCIVPEKREEVTTEGGLNVKAQQSYLKAYIEALKSKSIRVSLFIDPDRGQVEAASKLGADIIELHTGRYCDTQGAECAQELVLLQKAAHLGASLGLEIHAGHGLSFDTVRPIAAIPEVVELNIGHFLMGEALFTGLQSSIHEMRCLMDEGRQPQTKSESA